MATIRKYAIFGETTSEYSECTNNKCKWIGKEEDQDQVPDSDPLYSSFKKNVCPKCGNDEFYKITQEWAEKNIKLPVLTYNIELFQ